MAALGTSVSTERVADSRPDMVDRLARLPGFRNVLIHDYIGPDMDRVVDALDDLRAIEEFAAIVARAEAIH